MIELRDMQILVALARHRHFARAAAECGISQPAFSMRIRKLEDRLGVSIVKRGNRFQGFTEEGELVLRRARSLLEDAKALEQEVRSARGAVAGRLTIGVVPTALVFAAQATVRLHRAYPQIVVQIRSATSLQIQQGLEDGTVEAGITYEEGVSGDVMRITRLYQESYVLVAPRAIAPRDQGSASWAEAAALPLSLLEPQMQNRRILDRVFDEIGAEPRVVAETNAFTSSLVLAAEGVAATIIPEVLAASLGAQAETVVLPLSEPQVEKAMCLISLSRRPVLPVVAALERVLGEGA